MLAQNWQGPGTGGGLVGALRDMGRESRTWIDALGGLVLVFASSRSSCLTLVFLCLHLSQLIAVRLLPDLARFGGDGMVRLSVVSAYEVAWLAVVQTYTQGHLGA